MWFETAFDDGSKSFVGVSVLVMSNLNVPESTAPVVEIQTFGLFVGRRPMRQMIGFEPPTVTYQGRCL